MTTDASVVPAFDTDDLEPSVTALMDRKEVVTRTAGPHVPVGEARAREGLEDFLSERAPGAKVGKVAPLGGGASKEQYVVGITAPGADSEETFVLRLDALQGVMETDRQREFDVLRLVAPHLPVPAPVWVDAGGESMGRPWLMTRFVDGVTKPTDTANDSVSGLQTNMGPELRNALGKEFVEKLAQLHQVPVDGPLGTLGRPDADPFQAARWQVNWWTRVWRDDKVVSHPLVAQVEMWLRERLPRCSSLSVVHGDYRTGNYLFDESSRTITAILDWELAHIGDFHEDLGWAIQRMYSTVEDGTRLVTGLMPREELIASYEAASGRSVSPETLHFYEVLCAYKSTVATLASSVRAAAARHNHQDVLLSWLASCGYVFVSRLCELIEEGPRA